MKTITLRTRILTIVCAALIGLVAMATYGLHQLRQTLHDERRTQIAQLLDVAEAQLKYFHAQESAGKMTRDEAQARAREAISAQRTAGNYFIVRNVADNMLMIHGNPARVGKIDAGGKTTDGRPVMEVYQEEIRSSKDGKGFVLLEAIRPGSEDKTMYKKLNGASVFAPWNWLVAIGFFIDDIDRIFWRDAVNLMIIGSLLLGIVGFLAFRTMRSILAQLGGEPAYATEIARGIASGNLSQEIAAADSDVSLLGSMKTMQGGLHDMAMRFNQASTTLADAARRLAEETERISNGSRKTSDATSSTAAAVEQMTVSINRISDNARETEQNSRHAAAIAVDGEQLARDAAAEIQRVSADIGATSTLIRGLVERSREIDAMSAVIRDIADQTNLLALNAAIEAARAGETGRGFAVVADEVRKLAERTGGATQDITRTIRAVQSDTDAAAARMDDVRNQISLGAELAEKAAQALQQISQSTRTTLEKTSELADASREQGQASDNIAANVEQIARMVEEADASVQAAHMQVRQLDHLAHELHQAAEKFRL